jgi:putative transposase
MGVSRQAYYQYHRRKVQRVQQDRQVLNAVVRIRQRQPRLGTRKLHYLLNTAAEAVHIGRDRLFNILREHRLLITPTRSYRKTTFSHHRFRRHPNLLKAGPDQVVATGPEQVWVADITYLPTKEHPAYLSLVTDAYSRKIVGHSVHTDMTAESVVGALREALTQRKTRQRLVHHSDRGIQYCSAVYQQVHRQHGLTCSMTDGYDCYQNALAERINGILKAELLVQRPANLRQARRMVAESVAIYNGERPHSALKNKTPDAVHRGSG